MNSTLSRSRWAVLKSNRVIGPEPVSYSLGPCEGNMHELHALEDAVFFDIIFPPDNPCESRPCTYFAPAPVGLLDQTRGVGRGHASGACLHASSAGGRWLLVPTT